MSRSASPCVAPSTSPGRSAATVSPNTCMVLLAFACTCPCTCTLTALTCTSTCTAYCATCATIIPSSRWAALSAFSLSSLLLSIVAGEGGGLSERRQRRRSHLQRHVVVGPSGRGMCRATNENPSRRESRSGIQRSGAGRRCDNSGPRGILRESAPLSFEVRPLYPANVGALPPRP